MKFKYLLLLTLVGSLLPQVWSTCSEGFFDCGNGKCLAHFFVCDGDNDCGNWLDEMNCDSVDKPPVSDKTCPENHFACNDIFETCIPQRWVCDGLSECSNGADEQNCTSDKLECGDDFKCHNNHQCVSMAWRCDGIFDCDDNSDETNCTTYKKHEFCDKEHGKFQCKSGQCIPFAKRCDGQKDCLDGDDEGAECDRKTCHDKKCSHLCLFDVHTNASVCFCPPGFKTLNNNTCIDYDECENNKLANLCSQKCINLEGSYKCACFDGYEMVNGTCQAKGESPILYVSTEKEIRAFDIRNSDLLPVAESVNGEAVVSMDMLVRDRKLFYSGLASPTHSTVYSVVVDGGNQLKTDSKALFHQSLSKIEGIAVDWLARNYYFTESNLNKIIVCSVDKPVCTTLITDLQSPRGILVVPEEANLFWTQWDDIYHGVYRAKMDGSEHKLMFGDISWPNDLAFDHVMNRLYWCDGKKGVIEYFDFDLQHRQIVLEDFLRQPYSLFVFEDTLYWSDWSYQELLACNKFDCHQIEHPLLQYHGPKRGFYGVTVYHPELQKSRLMSHNPCEYHGCSHICLLRSKSSYSCHCPDHSELDSDRKTCITKPDQSYLLLSTGFQIYKYFPRSTSDNFELLNIATNYHISNFAFNSRRNEIYLHDQYKDRIGKIDLKKSVSRQWSTMVDTDIDVLMGLVYEPNTDNLYWVDMLLGTLEVVTTSGPKYHRAILNSDLTKPISLAIEPRTKTMFVGLRIVGGNKIVSLSMDGKFQREILSSKTGLPLVLTSVHEELIWGDPIEQKIDFVLLHQRELALSQPRKMIENHVDTVNSLAVDGTDLYWTNTDSLYIYSSPLNQTGRVFSKRPIEDDHFDSDMVKIVSGSTGRPVSDQCVSGNHHCAHICLLGPISASCVCAQGYTTVNGGKTCVKSRAKVKVHHSHPLNIFHLFDLIGKFQSSKSNETWSVIGETNSAKSNSISNATVDDAIDVLDSYQAVPLQATSRTSPLWPIMIIVLLVVGVASLYKLNSSPTPNPVNNFVSTVRARLNPTDRVRFFPNPSFEPSFSEVTKSDMATLPTADVARIDL